MTFHFSRYILFARQHRAGREVTDTLQSIADFLQSLQLPVFLEQESSTYFQQLSLPQISIAELTANDLIIVIGGDGSLLAAGKKAAHYQIPVLGINRGRLGFLTDITPNDIENQLKQVIMGAYQEEQRFLLCAHFTANDQQCYTKTAINDVVLMPGEEPYMIEFEIYINQQLVCHQRADGIIVATPTGSTAYALSAGGPILHPQLDALVMVPMFPHKLSSRPIVVSGDSAITIRIHESNETSPRLSCDGEERLTLSPGQSIDITKAERYLRLLHPVDYQYYQTLRAKLGWESKH